jgi:hypothetical protein
MGKARGKQRGFGLLIGLVLGVELMASGGRASGQRSSPDESGQQPRIEVQVYNYAQVSNQTLERGEEEAARIFHVIGVETAWQNCNPATMDIHLATECVPHKGLLNLTARIVPAFAVAQGVAERQTMGLSFGDLASVSYRWVTNEAGELNIAPSDILGPALAHELAHLLLRQPGHSKVGIMRPRWSREDFDTATHGTFSFTREQAEAIRSDIRERSQQQAGRDAAISVQVYNYSQVPNEVVTQAESAAEDIFRAAGVEIAWTNCKLPEDSQCATLLDPTHLGVRLLPEIGQAFDSSNRTMGLAVGHLATVSMRRVQEDAAEFGVHLEEVLGPAMAHEIGHLLLVSGGHSPAGIMRARWRREDYERAPRGAFTFTSEQGQSIRTEIRRRIQERAATAIATK